MKTFSEKVAELAIEEKKWALASFLNIDKEEIKYDKPGFTCNEGDYYVFTDEEADEYVKNYIIESIWAFEATFIAKECDLSDFDNAVKGIRSMQESCNDSCNVILLALIEKTCGIEEFINDAINADGRGHFISSYDGEENELEDEELFVYRYN